MIVIMAERKTSCVVDDLLHMAADVSFLQW